MNKKICDDCPYVLDSLTGLIRRELFSEKLKDNRLCDVIVVCDIDFFKTFNDSYGHLAGDVVLKEFSLVLKDRLKDNEIVARFGGEEFVLALIGGVQRAEEFFEDVKNNMKDIEFHGEILPKITFSAGTSELYRDIWSAFSKADKAVYFSKKNGRDQINHYEHVVKFIENLDQKKNITKNEKEKNTGYAIFSVWEREKVFYEKGSRYIEKILSDFEKELRKRFDIVEIFRTNHEIICMVFKGKRDPDSRLIAKDLTKEFPDMSGVLNFYPGITSFAYLERDTFNAFLSLSLFEENQGIILYSVKAIRAIGVYHFRREEFKLAYEHFRRAYRIQKNDYGIMNLAASMIGIKKYLSALIILEAYQESLLNFEQFFVNLSLCYYKRKNKKKTMDIIKEGLKRFPESEKLLKNIKEAECLEKD